MIIDMQNDFVTGALANRDAEAIVPAIKNEIAKADVLIFTKDTHPTSYLSSQEGRKLPIEHCIENTWGWEIVDALNPEKNDFGKPVEVICKPNFGWDWNKLRSGLIDTDSEVVFTGTCTDICVVSNALSCKQAFPETEVSCIASCCAGLTAAKHEAALEVMRSCQVTVI